VLVHGGHLAGLGEDDRFRRERLRSNAELAGDPGDDAEALALGLDRLV
jgi:hypothetical protein